MKRSVRVSLTRQQTWSLSHRSLSAAGRLTVSSATSDIGTGTYTIMTQIAADTLGLPMEDVTFKLGDSSLPMSPAWRCTRKA